MKTLLQTILALLLCASLAAAEDTSLWTNLGSLHAGQRVGIVRADHKRLEGTFVSNSDAAITIDTGQPETVPKDQVIRVYQRGHLTRPVRTLSGAAIGATAGAILNGTGGKFARNEGNPFGDIAAVTFI